MGLYATEDESSMVCQPETALRPPAKPPDLAVTAKGGNTWREEWVKPKLIGSIELYVNGQIKDDFQFEQSRSIITALARRFDANHSCFMFGEIAGDFSVDFELEDVLYIIGLPIDGKQVSGWEMSDSIRTIRKHLKIDKDMAKEMLLVKRGKMANNIKTSALRNKFQAVPKDAQDLETYFKTYILCLLGTVIIPNGLAAIVPMFLPLLESKNIDEYAWGATLVAHLKFLMAKGKTNLGRFTWALLVFALERFPYLRHGSDDDRPTGDDRPTQFPLFIG
ncbi:hypothetical protein OROGR_025028 [Orobanche gracilis]